MYLDTNNCRIELIRGDITDQEVDAIVNAANASLAGGGGVDGAIHRRGGSAIMRETDEKYPNGCPTGSAVASGAGKRVASPQLPSASSPPPPVGRLSFTNAGVQQRRIISTVRKHQLRSSVLRWSISTGIYGFPIDRAVTIAIQTVADFLRTNSEPLRLVRFRLFSDADSEIYSKA